MSNKQKKKDTGRILSTIIALLGIVVSIVLFICENRRVLKVSELEWNGVNEILELEEQYFENQYTESFLHNFSDAYVLFDLKNHSQSDIEIYGFYLEIQVENLFEKILVPLEATIKGEEEKLSVFLSDWSASAEIDKYVVKQNTGIEVFASLEETCRDLSHIWFLDSGLCEGNYSISKKLQNTYLYGRKLQCKCRIVCKDTLGNYYYSLKETIDFIPKGAVTD